MKAIAAGVAKHDNAAELKAWRTAIARHAADVCGEAWIACNAPITVSVVLTVPSTAHLAPTPQLADGYRDLDKLQRATGDALCPSDAAHHFRFIASDMRIVHWDADKTYARPAHTHPDALPEPGAVIRVELATLPTKPLTDPVPQPTRLR